MGKNRTRAQRARITHKRRVETGRVTDTDGYKQPDSTGTTDGYDRVGDLLVDPAQIRSDLRAIELAQDDFTDEEWKKIRRRMGEIVMTGEDKVAVQAKKVELLRIKLHHDLLKESSGEGTQSPAPAVNVNVNVDQGRTDVFAIAQSLGMRIDLEGEEKAAERLEESRVLEGEAMGRSPQEDTGGTSAGRDISS